MRQLAAEIWMRARALVRRRKAHDELEAELRHHLEMEAASLVEQGMTPAEARRRAVLAFGSVAGVREACRDEHGVSLIEDLGRDLAVGTRSLLRAPSFAAASLLSLALGVGAATVIFAIVDAAVLRPLPFAEPDRLVRFYELTPEGDRFSTSDLNVIDFRARSRTLTGIAASTFPTQSLLLEAADARAGAGEPSRIRGTRVTGNFFDVLGVPPALGRAWTADETAPGERPRSVVLSHGLWQRMLGGAKDLVGAQLRLGGEPWTVLGVMPPGFRFGAETDLWMPYPLDLERPRGDHRLAAYARLAPGVAREAAEEELRGIMADLGRTYPVAQGGWGVELRPLEEVLLGDDARPTAAALVVAVGLLLLLACANVSSLLLARATGRVRELAMRRALGAGRGRLVRQLLTESMALGLAGAVAGGLLAAAALPAVRTLGAGALPRIEDAALDPRAAAVAAFLALVTAMIFGTLPAFQATAGAGTAPDRTSERAAGSRRGIALRSALVAGQLALALVLTSSALLLVRSLGSLRAVPIGFEVEQLLAVDVTLPPERYGEGSDAVTSFYRAALEKVRALPGVEHAGGHTTHPFQGPGLANTVALPEVTERSAFVEVGWRALTPGTLRTMGTPLLRGRDFRDQEAGLVTILSASLAERLFGDQEPIGRRVRWLRPEGPVAEVVGVVADVRDMSIADEPVPMYYWHQDHMRWPDLTLLVRSQLPVAQLAGPLRAAVRAVDPLLAPPAVSRVRDDLRRALATPRLNVRVFSAFAAIAAVIALVGVYGLTAYAAARRQRELAVRMALGAEPGAIRRLLLGQGVRLMTLGLAAGIAGIAAVSRLLHRLLFETSALDVEVLALSAVAFAAASLAACLAPAIRAARQSPLASLRAD